VFVFDFEGRRSEEVVEEVVEVLVWVRSSLFRVGIGDLFRHSNRFALGGEIARRSAQDGISPSIEHQKNGVMNC